MPVNSLRHFIDLSDIATGDLMAMQQAAKAIKARRRSKQAADDHCLAGKVVACHAESGELSVQVSPRTGEDTAEQTVYCLVTDDAEIYVNDRFSSIEEIQLGDMIELIGYHDPDPQLDRFVVSFAYLDHPLPAPPRPNLAPTSGPASRDTEEQQAEEEE